MLMKMQAAVQSDARFQQIRDRFEGESSFSAISKAARGDYAQVFENVALLRQAGFLRPELAFYMFGFEALRCWRNDSFWEGMDRNEWWRLLRAFVAELETLEQTPPKTVRI
jgi:hypothetical protein